MYREFIAELQMWKKNKHKKPLIISGARQVGKTWLMKEFGKQYYDSTVYLNFERNTALKSIFDDDLNPNRIVQALQLVQNVSILPSSTLLIFDEVQECPRSLTSLKYFCEEAPQYDIVCAGLLLGIALHKGTSFPVGKVDMLHLYPMSFKEFLLANNETRLVQVLDACDFKMLNLVSSKLNDYLQRYYYVGGMPEVVNNYIIHKDFELVKKIQETIIYAYSNDFSKHTSATESTRINEVYKNISNQLVKENKKFVYGFVRQGARAKDYEVALMWLKDCGLIHQVFRVKTPKIPLDFYKDNKAFKLFLSDVGLLSCLAGIGEDTVNQPNKSFVEFKGAIAEQFVLQELKLHKDLRVYYYSNERHTSEIDFLLDYKNNNIPVEVKSSINLRAKSLAAYNTMFSPKVSFRLSPATYKKTETLIDLPLYAVSCLPKMLEKNI
ncbi:MAG: ATPase [Treponema sp. CETP13]|nr:MAG: ATPase [Treponema sp. CETP13]